MKIFDPDVLGDGMVEGRLLGRLSVYHRAVTVSALGPYHENMKPQ